MVERGVGSWAKKFNWIGTIFKNNKLIVGFLSLPSFSFCGAVIVNRPVESQ
jgi:hypothetical protein